MKHFFFVKYKIFLIIYYEYDNIKKKNKNYGGNYYGILGNWRSD